MGNNLIALKGVKVGYPMYTCIYDACKQAESTKLDNSFGSTMPSCKDY